MKEGIGARLLVLTWSFAAIPVPAAALTISDATFPEAPWSASELLDSSGAATSSASQQLAGGFPDAFRQTTHSIPAAGQSIIVGHVFSGAQYDPSGEGAIASIDFSLDLRFIGGSVGTAQVGYQLILVQGGTHYNGLATAAAVARGPGNGLPGAWSSHSFSALTASSFTRLFGEGPTNPDFSAGGSGIQFGYLTQNTSIDTGLATSSGIDNWSVTVHPVPELPAIGLVGTALFGVAVAGQRLRGPLVR